MLNHRSKDHCLSYHVSVVPMVLVITTLYLPSSFLTSGNAAMLLQENIMSGDFKQSSRFAEPYLDEKTKANSKMITLMITD